MACQRGLDIAVAYGSEMGFAGLIFVALAVVWLIYLVPLLMHRHDNGLLEEVEPGEPFTSTVTIVRRGAPLDSAESALATVSTPLNRRAALKELDLIDRRAAIRRSTVLAVLLLAMAVLGVLVFFNVLLWWSVLIPAGLVVVFLTIARVAVVRMRAGLEARAERIRSCDQGAEETMAIEVLEETLASENEDSVDLSAPIVAAPSLWDPIPVIAPSYVSKPLAPRTVRTIDLTAPIPVHGIPVTADPQQVEAPEGEERRAFGA